MSREFNGNAKEGKKKYKDQTGSNDSPKPKKTKELMRQKMEPDE